MAAGTFGNGRLLVGGVRRVHAVALQGLRVRDALPGERLSGVRDPALRSVGALAP